MTALISLLGLVARVGSVIGKYYPTHKNIFPESPNFEAWDYPIWQVLYGIRENPAQPERWHTMCSRC